jgi:hypothetical protein
MTLRWTPELGEEPALAYAPPGPSGSEVGKCRATAPIANPCQRHRRVTRRHSGSGPVGTRPLAPDVVGHSQAVLSCASAAMSRVEREIDHLWRDSMKAEDAAMSQRLADVSHALREAARVPASPPLRPSRPPTTVRPSLPTRPGLNNASLYQSRALHSDSFRFSRTPHGRRPLHPDNVAGAFRRICRRQDISGFRLHDLRHARATQLLAAGVPVRTVSGRLGHTNGGSPLETVQRPIMAVPTMIRHRHGAAVRPVSHRLWCR